MWVIIFNTSILLHGESESHSVVSNSLQPHWLYNPCNSPGQNTGMGSLSLLQRIFPTQWSNPGLPHCRWIFYQLTHKGSPRILVWVAYPFSSGSSQPRNRTGISCIAGRFFTNWAMRKVQEQSSFIFLSSYTDLMKRFETQFLSSHLRWREDPRRYENQEKEPGGYVSLSHRVRHGLIDLAHHSKIC